MYNLGIVCLSRTGIEATTSLEKEVWHTQTDLHLIPCDLLHHKLTHISSLFIDNYCCPEMVQLYK